MLEQTGWDRDEKQGRTTSFKVLLPTTGPESSYAYILNTDKVPNVRSFPGGTSGKEPACSVGDLDLIPGLGRSPGVGHGNPLQDSCLKNQSHE